MQQVHEQSAHAVGPRVYWLDPFPLKLTIKLKIIIWRGDKGLAGAYGWSPSGCAVVQDSFTSIGRKKSSIVAGHWEKLEI